MFTLFFLGMVVLLCWGFFVQGPRIQQKKLDEENDRLLDREMLRSMYAHLHNQERMLENQLLKKIYVQTLDTDDADLQVKPIAEKIVKVIGK